MVASGHKGVKHEPQVLKAVRRVQAVTTLEDGASSTDALEEAVSLAHHHDGITGTAKQHVADDYNMRIAAGAHTVQLREHLSPCVSHAWRLRLALTAPSAERSCLRNNPKCDGNSITASAVHRGW